MTDSELRAIVQEGARADIDPIELAQQTYEGPVNKEGPIDGIEWKTHRRYVLYLWAKAIE